ncbi:MAG: hypothetical protein AAB550_01800 [Patescibacteria group bacterium]
MKKKLKTNYLKYQKRSKKSQSVVDFLRSFMPEIIFRTFKLEGEPVTRKMVKTLF